MAGLPLCRQKQQLHCRPVKLEAACLAFEHVCERKQLSAMGICEEETACPAHREPPYTERVVVSEMNLIICDISPVIWVPSVSYRTIQITEALEV